MKKIVLTGACGALGMQIRETLAAQAEMIVSVDIAPAPDALLPNESFVQADVSEMDEMMKLAEGADMIVHFAAIPDERPFDELLKPNFIASYNVWEAAHRNGVRRVVYASSVHGVGLHENAAGIGVDADHFPDTFYGLSKCFTEDMAKMYWAKRGLESVHLRIFSCTPEPGNVRALGTWLSYEDLRRLVKAAVQAHTTGFMCIYGVSNNDRAPVNNTGAMALGYRPKDNAEDWAETLMASAPPSNPQDRAQMCIGGPFATVPLGESGVAGIKAMTAPTKEEGGAAPKPNADKLPSFLSRKTMI